MIDEDNLSEVIARHLLFPQLTFHCANVGDWVALRGNTGGNTIAICQKDEADLAQLLDWETKQFADVYVAKHVGEVIVHASGVKLAVALDDIPALVRAMRSSQPETLSPLADQTGKERNYSLHLSQTIGGHRLLTLVQGKQVVWSSLWLASEHETVINDLEKHLGH